LAVVQAALTAQRDDRVGESHAAAVSISPGDSGQGIRAPIGVVTLNRFAYARRRPGAAVFVADLPRSPELYRVLL
jgi:hypothetical protein